MIKKSGITTTLDIRSVYVRLQPAVQFTNGSSFERGSYEYTPAAIAAEDIVVLVDKPEPQTGDTNIATNFNLQYETVNLPVV